MSSAHANGPWPGGPPRTAPPPRRDGSGPALLVGVLALLGVAMTILAVLTARTPTGGGELPDPLRFVPVTAAVDGPCSGAETGATVTDRGSCLTLRDSGGLAVQRLQDARAEPGTTGDWGVLIVLRAGDARAFADLTATVAGAEPGGSRLAMVLGDELLTAPVVSGRIDGGEVVISGGFSRQEAEDLAGRLRA
ncbi:SecDF P1 head subdomain-containing protein [Streptomyces sp. MS19]|uniref:SecDF P1 head subdomain-containing protein n=1 Tax=Streptomyces sp. MS19 TaxID=3385972 RepID=UPI0039A24092